MNCELFADDEENKIVYMDIFNEYTATIEKLIMEHLKANVGDEELSLFFNELRWAKLASNTEFNVMSFLSISERPIGHLTAKFMNCFTLSPILRHSNH